MRTLHQFWNEHNIKEMNTISAISRRSVFRGHKEHIYSTLLKHEVYLVELKMLNRRVEVDI